MLLASLLVALTSLFVKPHFILMTLKYIKFYFKRLMLTFSTGKTVPVALQTVRMALSKLTTLRTLDMLPVSLKIRVTILGKFLALRF
jgi:hypothetical protein